MAAPAAPVVWYFVRRHAVKHGWKAGTRLAKGAKLYTRGKKTYRRAKRQNEKRKAANWATQNSKSSRRSTSVRNVRRGDTYRYNSGKSKFIQFKPRMMPRRGRRCPRGYRYNRKLNACVKK